MIDPAQPMVQAADWAVAVALLAGGLIAWRSSRVTAGLFVTAGVAWVLGGQVPVALFWHRALLVHLILGHPGLRPGSRPALTVTVVTYAVCVLAPATVLTEPVSVGLALALVGAAAWDTRGAVGRVRQHRRTALIAALVLASAWVIGSLVRVLSDRDASVLTLLIYEAAVVSATLVILADLRAPVTTAITDVVIDLGEAGTPTLRDTLARALRDPDLRLGFWDSAGRAYLDAQGRPLPSWGEQGRVTVPIPRDGRPCLMLDLDARLAEDPHLLEALAVAAQISATNAQRQAALDDEVRRLEASRRRLLIVADAERSRLAGELRRVVVARVTTVADDLRDLAGGGGSIHLRTGLAHLDRTVDDLADVAAGLGPRELAGGLPSALRQLAERSAQHVEVAVTVEARALPAEVAMAVWYVCAEALSNAAKHAPTAKVRLDVWSTQAVVHVAVTDDGPGGAELHERGGLLGLRDRVESLGGRFEVRSEPGRGTVLAVDIPSDGQTRLAPA